MTDHPCLCGLPPSERTEPDRKLVALAEAPVSANEAADGAAFAVRTDVRSANHGNAPGHPQSMVSPPRGIMLHHTAGSKNGDLATLTRSGTWVSSNDYVTKEPQIFELVPHPLRAWHAGSADSGTGYASDGNTVYWGIEIENLGNGRDPYPARQIDAIVWRCRQLRKRWGLTNPSQLFRHRDFAPSRKGDPSDNFPFAEVRKRVFAATDPTDGPGGVKPAPPAETGKPELVYLAAWAGPDVAVADAASSALKASGFPKAYVMRTAFDLSEASRKALAGPARPCLVIGGPTVPRLEAGARRAFEAGERERLLNCVGDGISQTQDMTAWRLKALATRIGLDPVKVLATYRAELGPVDPTPPKPPSRPSPAEVLAFGRRLKGTPYGDGWEEGTWPDGPSLYARCNPKVHTVAYVRAHELICSALINVLRAHLFGLPAVGRNQGDAYPGGTAAVGRTLARMKGSRPYKPSEIVPAGDLLHADYLGPALRLQGHEMVSTGDGRVLEARLPAVSDDRTALAVHQHLVRTTGQGVSRVIPFDVWTRA